MITIDRIANVQRDQFDEVWAIVRFFKGNSEWIKQVPELSPSHQLWAKFHKLRISGNWNTLSFNEIYLPAFLDEMQGKSAREKLNELYSLDREGKNIALVCFCTDESLCHRSIIAGLLHGAGCNVNVPSGKDYSSYYTEYLKHKKVILETAQK